MGRLEWSRRVERDRDVLERILVLLLALAALADRAAGLSAARRLHVLAILGCGEAEAREFIIAMASGAPAEAAAPTRAAGDAALLAARFRMLALALDALLAQARAPSQPASPSISQTGSKPRRPAQSAPSPALQATSPPARGRGVAASATMFFLRTKPVAPVAIGAPFPTASAIGAPLPRAGGEVAREA